jgi:hypothetical protein
LAAKQKQTSSFGISPARTALKSYLDGGCGLTGGLWMAQSYMKEMSL